jgi:hypothetical protein
MVMSAGVGGVRMDGVDAAPGDGDGGVVRSWVPPRRWVRAGPWRKMTSLNSGIPRPFQQPKPDSSADPESVNRTTSAEARLMCQPAKKADEYRAACADRSLHLLHPVRLTCVRVEPWHVAGPATTKRRLVRRHRCHRSSQATTADRRRILKWPNLVYISRALLIFVVVRDSKRRSAVVVL